MIRILLYKTQIWLLICTFFLSIKAWSQKEELRHTYYFDSAYKFTTEDSAALKNLQYKTSDGWRIEYYERKKKMPYALRRIETKSDTSNKPSWVKIVYYYPTGIPEEYQSIISGNFQSIIHYNKTGTKNAEVVYKNGKIVQEDGWDSTGKIIPNFIFRREATFPGGSDSWKKYLIKNLKEATPTKYHAPNGNYLVIVSFIVDKSGYVKQVKAENNPGYGTAKEAERVIAESPKWNPAVMMGENVLYRQRQQITFQVNDDQKKVDTLMMFLDAKGNFSSEDSAFYRLLNIRVNDTTRNIFTYSIAENRLLQKSKLIVGSDTKTHVFSTIFSDSGKVVLETEQIDKHPIKATKYYPNGVKESEVIFGDIGLPIKENRWDENGHPTNKLGNQ